jgi:hypothetical protein
MFWMKNLAKVTQFSPNIPSVIGQRCPLSQLEAFDVEVLPSCEDSILQP